MVLIQETNLQPPTDAGSKINHLTQVADDWVLATPSRGVTASNRGKGLLILGHPSLTASCPATASPLPVLKPVYEEICASFELLAAQITNVLVVNIYVHANAIPDYPALFSALRAIPGFQTSNVVVGGDFNHPGSRHILETEVMAPLGLTPAYHPDAPIPTRGDSCLDLMFWKGESINVSPMRASAGSTSDHMMVTVDVTGTDMASLVTPCAPPTIIMWDKCPDVPYDLLSDARKLESQELLDACTQVLADTCHAPDPLSAMTDGLLAAAATHLGTKQYRTKHRTPWWNKGLSKLHKRVRRAHKRTLKTGIPPDRHSRYVSEYKTVLAKYNHACSVARRRCLESYQTKFSSTDMNRTWAATASHRGKRHPRYLRRTAADPEKTCDFWSAVFSDPRFERPPDPTPAPTPQQLFPLDEVTGAAQNLNDTTPGEDGLRARLLRFLCGTEAMQHITTGLNRACAMTISDRAKTSVTVLIKKPKAVGADPGSYRPIALQPVMTKLLSKCVECRIWKQVDDGSVHLSNSQGGFRPNRSRYDLITLLRCAQEYYHPRGRRPASHAERRQIFAAFLDIKKAYDSVPHIKIVERLREAGVEEELVRVVLDLLSNRTTVIYGLTVHIGRGVPQGDPLSPLLFILMMQPLSDALAAHPYGGVELPGGLSLKDLLYADDISLLAESAEELQSMLSVCEAWAAENGFEFSVEKSKAMVLAGTDPPELPTVTMYGEALEWVREFKYLGCPIYANNKPHKCLPLDLTSAFQVVGPMASVVLPNSMPDLPLIQRVQAFVVMIESKAMHNAQVADLDTKNIDRYVNQGLRLTSGLLDSTFLRCELGVLPAELVVHRNALYYLWHLRRRAWFRDYLPALAHLPPVQRLTSMVLQYSSLRLQDVDSLDYDTWRGEVKQAVLDRSTTYYDTSNHQDYCLYPQPDYSFMYRGQAYLNNAHTTNLAQIAIELRHNRLTGVRNPWEHQPCVYCQQPEGLHGKHLLQCQQLPRNIMEERVKLIDDHFPGLTIPAFACSVIDCVGADIKDPGLFTPTDPLLLFLCKGLALGRKILRHARKAHHAALHPPEEPVGDESEPDVSQLFWPEAEDPVEPPGACEEEPSAAQQDNELPAAVPTVVRTCSLQALAVV